MASDDDLTHLIEELKAEEARLTALLTGDSDKLRKQIVLLEVSNDEITGQVIALELFDEGRLRSRSTPRQ